LLVLVLVLMLLLLHILLVGRRCLCGGELLTILLRMAIMGPDLKRSPGGERGCSRAGVGRVVRLLLLSWLMASL